MLKNTSAADHLLALVLHPRLKFVSLYRARNLACLNPPLLCTQVIPVPLELGIHLFLVQLTPDICLHAAGELG